MAQHILLYIEGNGGWNKNKNKTLYYEDGIVEIRSPQWELLESKDLGHELTMLDMKIKFNVTYSIEQNSTKTKKAKKKTKSEKLVQEEVTEEESVEEDESMEDEESEEAFGENEDLEEPEDD